MRIRKIKQRRRFNVLAVISLTLVLISTIQLYALGRLKASANDDDGQKPRRIQATSKFEASDDLTITHVVNLYKVGESQKKRDQFFPLDQAQNITIASMLRAKEKVHDANVHVNLIAAVFSDDLDIVPKGFDGSVLLTRSTADEYPVLVPPKKLPFLSDIFQLFGDQSKAPFDFDFLVYSNTDIALHENFYNVAVDKIRLGHDAFSINRRAIPKDDTNGRPFTDKDLDIMFDRIPRGETHPGYDCFVFHKSIVPRLHQYVGEMYLGFPPWGRALHYMAESKEYSWARNYTNFQSDELNATFHLGERGTWRDKNVGKKFVLRRDIKEFLHHCQPLAWRLGSGTNGMNTMEQYRLKNSLNCAAVFARWEKKKANDNSGPPVMPLLPGEKTISIDLDKVNSKA